MPHYLRTPAPWRKPYTRSVSLRRPPRPVWQGVPVTGGRVGGGSRARVGLAVLRLLVLRLLVLGLLVLGLLGLTAACGTTPTSDPLASTRPTPVVTPNPSETGPTDCQYVGTGDPARPVEPPSETGVPKTGSTTYVMATNEGDITLTLDRKRAPCAVHSF